MECDRVRNLMAEYIGQDLDDSTKEEVACHLDSCDSCFDEIKKLDRTIWALECDCRASQTSQDFLNGMEERILAGIKPRINIPKIKIQRKVIWIVSAAAAAVLLAVSFVYLAPVNYKYKVYAAATFGKVYSTDDGTFGKRINISSTSSNIKVTATKISADDMGTVIYFKIDGSNDEYYADYSSLVIKERLKTQTPLGTHTLIGSSFDSGGFILYLNPVEVGTKLLHISLSRIYRIVDGQNVGTLDGIWSFTIPAEKINPVFYDINKSYDLDGHNIIFKKLASGPTGTYLQYECDTTNLGKYIAGLNECELTSVSQRYKYVEGMGSSGNSYVGRFASMYPENPDKLTLNIKSYNEVTTYEKGISIPVDIEGSFPMDFQYNGSTITVNNFKNDAGNIKFNMVETIKGRNYNYMYLGFEDGKGTSLDVNMITQKCYVIDENDVEYNYDDVRKNIAKYKDKHFRFYPVDTAISFKMRDQYSRYFNIIIGGSMNINRVNKSITLK